VLWDRPEFDRRPVPADLIDRDQFDASERERAATNTGRPSEPLTPARR
jgi:hypothetical protein